jgi:uncharacterized protein (UPF0210 family)
MAAPDRFSQWKEAARQKPTFPLTQVVDVDVVKSDGTDLPFLPRAIHVVVAGAVVMNVGVTTPSVTITTTLEAGWHPICPTRIWSTGTGAIGITAWA